ncbi:MAG: hypothetical protein JO325_11145 [Solirubrobacterales bacterium]|nr:hypothetical protein [Solirubrobacterales bacterium]
MAPRLTERDLELLSFLSEHRLALPAHAAVLLGTSAGTAAARLSRLADGKLLRREAAFPGEPPWYRITQRGLAVIGSSLPTPKLDLRSYQHDVGVAWLWLAVRGGAFGPVNEIVGERRLRSMDGARAPGDPALAVRLGGFGPRGRERLHYPDLVLHTADGRRIALELELTPKARTRLETILGGYGADPRFDGVVYLVERAAIARSVRNTACRLGVCDLVAIRRVRLTAGRRPASRTAIRERVAEVSR